jgi:hypothetical protein
VGDDRFTIRAGELRALVAAYVTDGREVSVRVTHQDGAWRISVRDPYGGPDFANVHHADLLTAVEMARTDTRAGY